MKSFNSDFIDFNKLPKQEPDFNNLLKVLNKEKPARYTLFEFFLNPVLEERLSGISGAGLNEDKMYVRKITAFKAAGYDYVTFHASNFSFPHKNNEHNKKSISVNEGAIIVDRESFEKYQWPDPEEFYNGRMEKIAKELPEGMKIVLCGPGGVLENVTALMGYDNLCYNMADDEDLVEDVFNLTGQRIYDYYRLVIDCPQIGAIISNDDWGFNTQTMLSVENMRKYVFPWHRKIAELAHKAGKPVILHSCGNLERVYDDIAYDMKFDGKHSYEDKILPVEKAYDMLSDKFAILGGIDLDFICREEPEKIYKRACELLEKTQCRAYALGTGNSVPIYVPQENYLSMISAVLQNRY